MAKAGMRVLQQPLTRMRDNTAEQECRSKQDVASSVGKIKSSCTLPCSRSLLASLNSSNLPMWDGEWDFRKLHTAHQDVF